MPDRRRSARVHTCDSEPCWLQVASRSAAATHRVHAPPSPGCAPRVERGGRTLVPLTAQEDAECTSQSVADLADWTPIFHEVSINRVDRYRYKRSASAGVRSVGCWPARADASTPNCRAAGPDIRTHLAARDP